MKANNSKTNKVLNRNFILKMFILNSPVSRIQLSKYSGLSKMSLTNIISEFSEKGYIKETGVDLSATGKRKPILLELADGCVCAIGISITRSYIEGCLADIKGNMMYSKRVELPEDTTAERITTILGELISSIKNICQTELIGVGISAIGPLDMETGRILSPTNFYGIENYDVVKEVKKFTDLPVYLYKNTNCAALAEKYYGAGRKNQNFVYIGVSKGLGASAVINDNLLLGTNGYSCELGHITVNPDGEKCACGNKGCLEIYTNIVSMVEKVSKRVANGAKTILKTPITFESIIDGAKKGDKLCIDTLDELCKYLAVGVINAINVYDPTIVILGNDIAMGGDEIISRLKKNVGTTPVGAKHNNVEIIMSKFYDKAPLLGAATVVFDNLMFA